MIFKIIFTIAICFIFSACPPAAKKPPAKKPKAKQGEVREKPKEAQTPTIATPQRKASDRLVEKGVAELDAKNYDQASQLFQDAVNVDASNGAAYYYLAMTDHYLGQDATASGLLDKAESLLRYDQSWMDKIEDLRAKITGEKPLPLPPVGDQY